MLYSVHAVTKFWKFHVSGKPQGLAYISAFDLNEPINIQIIGYSTAIDHSTNGILMPVLDIMSPTLRFMPSHPLHQYSTLSRRSNSCSNSTVMSEITRIMTPMVAPYPKLYCWNAC